MDLAKKAKEEANKRASNYHRLVKELVASKESKDTDASSKASAVDKGQGAPQKHKTPTPTKTVLMMTMLRNHLILVPLMMMMFPICWLMIPPKILIPTQTMRIFRFGLVQEEPLRRNRWLTRNQTRNKTTPQRMM